MKIKFEMRQPNPEAAIPPDWRGRRDLAFLAIASILCSVPLGPPAYAKAARSVSQPVTLHENANGILPAAVTATSVEPHTFGELERGDAETSATSQPVKKQAARAFELPAMPNSHQLFSVSQLDVHNAVAVPVFGEVAPSHSFQSFAQLDTTQKSEPVSGMVREGGTEDNIDDPVTLSQVTATTATTATSQLDIALGHRGVYSDLLSLQDRILDSQRPVANAVSRYSTQSDNLNIFWEEISQDIYFNDGADRLRPGVQYIDYSPRSAPGVRQYSVGADGTYRFNDQTALSGDFWLNDIHPKNFRSDLIPTYDLFLTLLPSDFVRIDVDTKREIFDNVRSLQLGINAESVGGSVDYSPTDHLRLTLRGTGSFYSDTNERQFGEVEAVWRVFTGPTVEVGVRGSAFHFSKQLNNGYFNPNRYTSGEALFRVQTELTDRLTAELAGAGGVENVDPGGSKPLVKGSLQMIYKLSDRWNLDGGISYFSSQDTSSSGFARTSYTLGLHYKFD